MAAMVVQDCSVDEYVDHHVIILNQLRNQRSEGKYCDLIIKVLGYSVAVHSCVLAAFSPYIDNVLSNLGERTTVKSEETIELHLSGQKNRNPRLYSRALNIVLDYIYTGKLSLNEYTLASVKTIAEKMQLKEVIVQCNKFQSTCCKTKSTSRLIKSASSLNTNIQKSKLKSKSDEKNVSVLSPKNPPINGFQSESEHIVNEKNKTNSESENMNYKKTLCCDKCMYVAKTLRQLKAHMQTHMRKSHSCCSCGFISGSIKELITHLIEKQHNDTICSVCAYQADSIDDLTGHIQQHDHRKPFFCFSCDSRFLTYTALKLHLPKHSNQKPFACKICNKRFKWKHVLQNHNLVHSQEKQHLCDQCGFRTAHQSTFKAHCLLHTGNMFKCSHPGCTFQTLRKQNLQHHLQTHRKEKPYQCEICGQAFSLVKNLKRHARIHSSTGNTLHCNKCLFTTTRIDKLKEHLRKHHLLENHKNQKPSIFPNPQVVIGEGNGENLDDAFNVKTLSSHESSENQFLTYSTIPVTQIMPIYTITTLATDAE